MDRFQTILGIVLVLVAAILLMKTQITGGPGSSQKIQISLPTVDVTTAKLHLSLYEDVGPNEGDNLSGTVKIYKTEITDPYRIPSDAVMVKSVDVNGDDTLTTVTLNDTFKTEQNHFVIWLLGEANDHYPAVVKFDKIPTKATDSVYEGSVAIGLKRVAQLTWSADDVYRGTDSPVLRWSSREEVYKTDFVIKPSIDFETDRPSGVFVMKKVTIEAGDANEMAKIDSMDISVGKTEFDSLSASDLPKTKRLDKYVEITRDAPLEVKATVTTKDGTNSLTSGKTIFDVKVEDVLGNTYTVAVKAA